MSSPVAQVAVGVPLRRLFDYRIPVGMQVAIGSRVRVPFGRTRVIGVVSGLRDTSDLPADRLKPLTAVLDPVPLLGSDDLDADTDGTPDACDICEGFPDDADEDGDTVPDGCDQFPGVDDLADWVEPMDLDGERASR